MTRIECSQEFLRERTRLTAALGEMTDGGLVENCVHIGATQVLAQGDCIDLMICGYPLADIRERLHDLGYMMRVETWNAPVMQFVHTTGAFHLYVVESGSAAWTEFVIGRDYLLHDQHAHETYRTERAAWLRDPSRKERFFQTMWQNAQAWWIDFYGFAPIRELARELSELHMPWHVASGWALDLYLGQVTRVHHDLDIQIAYADQLILREYLAARGWKFVTPFDGKLQVWHEHLRVEPPRHQIHAHRHGAFIDILLSDIRAGVWRYRREPSITAAVEKIALTSPAGIPFLAPEIVLLFKSRNTSKQERSKDETDFARAVAKLEPERRAWLRWALLVTDSGHPWLAALD